MQVVDKTRRGEREKRQGGNLQQEVVWGESLKLCLSRHNKRGTNTTMKVKRPL